MWKQLIVAVTGVCGFAGVASAQFPGGQGYMPQYPFASPWMGGGYGGGFGGFGGFGGGNFMPNIYNPQTQPLSPYLNLMRGGNPGVNYYYGVRPGTIGGAGSFGGAAIVAPGGNRSAFFPQLAVAPDPLSLPDATEGYNLPSAGHPVVFNNTLGYFPVAYGYGRGGFGRTGLSGVNNSARPATRR